MTAAKEDTKYFIRIIPPPLLERYELKKNEYIMSEEMRKKEKLIGRECGNGMKKKKRCKYITVER